MRSARDRLVRRHPLGFAWIAAGSLERPMKESGQTTASFARLQAFRLPSGGGGIRTLDGPKRPITVFEIFATVCHTVVHRTPTTTSSRRRTAPRTGEEWRGETLTASQIGALMYRPGPAARGLMLAHSRACPGPVARFALRHMSGA